MRSITAHLDNEYERVRIGIGHPGAKELVQSWVLHDFARADVDWLEPLLDAMADAAPRLASGDAARFLTDVARQREPADEETEPAPTRRRRTEEGAPTGQRAERAPHPTGERAGKRATALAENLKNWLAKRRPKD